MILSWEYKKDLVDRFYAYARENLEELKIWKDDEDGIHVSCASVPFGSKPMHELYMKDDLGWCKWRYGLWHWECPYSAGISERTIFQFEKLQKRIKLCRHSW